MRIKGYSNFKVEIVTYNNISVICKSSNEEDKERLKKQINKQIEFFQKYQKNFNTKTPKIIKISEKKIYMEYIYFSENIIDYLQVGNIKKIDWITKNIINIIEKYINLSKYEIIDDKIIDDKIRNIQENIKNNLYIDEKNNIILKLFKRLKKIPNIKIPIGKCHGDLTFSNILIDYDDMNLFLIDFLDSFIESPLLDIVKIRQDTKYFWVTKMYNGNFDINSCLISLKYMDNIFDNYFKKYEFYNKYYSFFEALNILRVIQYSKNKDIISFFE